MMPNSEPPAWATFLQQHWLLAQVVAAAIATAAVFALVGSGATGTRLGDWLSNDRAALYGTVAALAGSLLGFVLAAATIILTIAGSPRLARVTGSNQYVALWSMFLMATKGLGALTLWSLAALVLDRDSSPVPLMTYGLLFLSVIAALQIGTCVWILERVTRLMTKPRALGGEGQPERRASAPSRR
jgi:hypothetical protein